MALVITEYQAFGVYRDEPVTQKAFQYWRVKGTGANTDATYDFGTYAGTFWTAAGGTTAGAAALLALRDIAIRAQIFLAAGGLGLNGKAQVDASRAGPVAVINSAASAGGAAAEAYVVTGLLTTDLILAVTQFVDGAGAAVGILSYGGATGNAAANDALTVTYNADPGAGAKVKVSVLRTTVTTPDAGTYQLAMDGTNTLLPNITFASGDAPTAFNIELAWLLKDGEQPVKAKSP